MSTTASTDATHGFACRTEVLDGSVVVGSADSLDPHATSPTIEPDTSNAAASLVRRRFPTRLIAVFMVLLRIGLVP
ncbi:MAG: hypothetical protein ACYC2O_14095 [Microthrixaceae bacterium]